MSCGHSHEELLRMLGAEAGEWPKVLADALRVRDEAREEAGRPPAPPTLVLRAGGRNTL